MSVNPRLQNTQQTYHLHYDQVGTLRVVTNAHGQNIKEITYDTFGHIRKDTNPSFNIPFGFAGGLYDVDTKLTRFGYRDYDAYTGKWTAKDPIGFDGGDSNLYGYVLGDPVSGFDPEGLEAYNCTKPLHALGGRGKKSGPDIGLNPFFHQYSCVFRNGKMECNGQDRTGGPWSPGKPSEDDDYDPETCTQIPSNDCFEKCLIEIWKKPRPYYGLFGPGTNCQRYDNSVNIICRLKCNN